MTISNAGKDVEKLDKSYAYIAGGSVKWYSHSVNTLAVSYKIRHATTIQPNTPLDIYTRELKTYLFIQKPVHEYSGLYS